MGGHLNLACRSFPVYHLVIVIVRYGVQKALFPVGNGGLYKDALPNKSNLYKHPYWLPKYGLFQKNPPEYKSN